MRSHKSQVTSHKYDLKKAIEFHGHLGPYLVLGLLAGELALKKLKARKYFGLKVKVWGANKKPKSCLIDGLQLATGATYGKGNIAKFNGSYIKIEIINQLKKRKIILRLKDLLIKSLEATKSHCDCELLAKRLYNTTGLSELFTYDL